MAKAALFWTLCDRFGSPLTVVKVTTVKGLRIFYGADENGFSTSLAARHAIGRFTSAEAARAALARIRPIRAEFRNRWRALETQRRQMHAEEEAAVQAAIADLAVPA